MGNRKMDVDLFDDIFDDLPDGAYFAMAEEMGLDVEDFAEHAERSKDSDSPSGLCQGSDCHNIARKGRGLCRPCSKALATGKGGAV